jgi:uncharacterized protein YjlB
MLEALEPRILLSADLPGVSADLALPSHLDPGSTFRQLPRADESVRLTEQDAARHELVFVDAGVEDYETLLAGLHERSGDRVLDVYVLDTKLDGISQIGDVLAGYSEEIDALHIISHGNDQGIQLGDTWLTLDNLASHSEALAGWTQSLSSGGDLLLYGCNLAGSADGRALVDGLSVLTGADVAASVDLTGSAILGGNWELEYAAGQIETYATFAVDSEIEWTGVLDNLTFQHGVDGYSSSSDTYLASDTPATDLGTSIQISVDDNPDQHGLIRFDNLFGNGPGQIPLGSTINSASLTIDVTDSSGSTTTISLHRMLRAWNESDTWNSMGAGIQFDDVEAASTPDGVLDDPSTWRWHTFNGLEAAVQSWADGDPNYGWAILSDNNQAWLFATSEEPDSTRRPVLSVNFTPPGSESVADHFGSVSYGNHDGTQPWTTDWQEVGEADGPGAGGMQVVGDEAGALRLGGFSTSDGDYVWRQADLSAATSATLNFQWKWEDYEPTAVVGAVEVRASDTDTWMRLGTFGGPSYTYQNFSQDITAYASPTTQIRFVIDSRESHDLFIDNVEIQYETSVAGSGTAIWSENSSTAAEANTFDGSSFGTEVGTADVGGPWQIIAGATSPTRDEKIVVGVDSSQNLSGQMWNGSSWTALPFNDFANVTSSDNWSFDVAYESQSGRAMLVYRNGSGTTNNLSYRIWDGTSWSGPSTILTPGSFDHPQLRLASSPSSDEMVLVHTDEARWDAVHVWDGMSWSSNTNLHNGSGAVGNTDVYVTYEQQSGHAMVVYGGSSGDVLYRIWDGASWSGQGVVSAPAGVSGVTRWTTLASDPGSDRIALGVNSDNSEVWFAVWNGSSWEASVEAASATPHADRQAVAVAFESGSGQALAAYAGTADQVLYQTWSAGSGWSGELLGPDLGDHPDSLTLDADPNSDTVMLSVVDQSKNVTFAAWDGASWATVSQQETDAGTNTGQPFLFLWDRGGVMAADAGGPYTISEGQSLLLDASGSVPPQSETLTYTWDLDGDAVYGDVTGETPTVDWATLQSFGIDDDDAYTIGLRVTDTGGSVATTTTSLSVVNAAPVVSATGAATVEQGSVYTLNLSVIDPGADTVSSWTIDWGDGTLETIAGNPSSVTHVYTRGGFTNNITVSVTDEDGTFTPGDVFVASNSTNSLFRFGGTDGALLQEFADLDGLNGPVDVEIGPDGLIYATGFGSDDVRRYDATTGAFVDQFVTSGSGGLDNPARLAFGSDGNLYVTSYNTDEVLRFDGTTGAFIDTFVTAGSGSLDQADAIGFGPDGNLYVGSNANGRILRYDGQTGAFIDVFASVGSSGFMDLTFGPDGNLYVSNTSLNKVQRFDATTGVKIDDFVSTGSGGISGTAGLGFGPDGYLYVVGWLSDNVLRYSSSDGSFVDEFISDSTGQNGPINLAFAPAQQVLVTHTADVPSVTSTTTREDTQSASGLVITRSAADGDEVTHFKITGITNGTLYLDDGTTAIAEGDFITAAEGAAGLKFTPALNYTGPASFDVQASTTGDDSDLSAAVTAPITVTPANDAPDGTDGTITTNEDAVYTFSAGDFGFSDPIEGDALRAIVITTVPASGTLTLGATVLSGGESISAAELAAGDLIFTPAPSVSGSAYTSFSFQVQDDGGTANGGVDLDPTPNTLSIDINPVNDAPSGTDGTITLFEDAAYTFSAADFGFSDPVEGDALRAIVVSTAPANGILSLGASVLTGGETVTAVELAAGDLVFTPAPQASGGAYASFSFQVQDDGGTANGGVDLDPTPNTLSLDVKPVNDAPSGSDGTITMSQGTSYSFSAADFGFSDPIDGHALQAVVISTAPVSGTLTLGASVLSGGETVTAAELAAGDLVFTPAPGASGSPYASFSFQVQDDGGTPNGGVDLDPTPNTLTINVSSVNAPPVASDDTVSTAQDAPVTIDVLANDTDPDGDTLFVLDYTLPSNGAITAINGDGTISYSPDPGYTGADSFDYVVAEASGGTAHYWRLDGNAVDAIGTADGVVNGATQVAGHYGSALAFDEVDDHVVIPDVTYAADFTLTFRFKVDDISGSSFQYLYGHGALDTPDSLNIYITEAGTANPGKILTHLQDANDPIDGLALEIDIGALIGDGQWHTYTLTVTSGGGAEVFLDGVSKNSDARGQDGLDPSGSVYLGAREDLEATRFYSGALDSLQLHDRALSGPEVTSLHTGGSARATVNISVTPVNQAPAGTDGTITTDEDTAYTFSAADFGFSDADGDSLQAVKITSVPGSGTLIRGATVLTGNELITLAELAAGDLVFAPGSEDSDAGYTSFTFQVQDDGGTTNGGIDLDPTPNMLTIDVNPVNDAPDGTDATVTTDEDTAFTFSASDFGFSDAVEGHGLQAVVISSAPANGTLRNGASVLSGGETITAAELAAGNLIFIPAPGQSGTGYASFTFQVQDDGGTANGGIDLDPIANTLTIDVNPVNDAPSGTDATITANEEAPYTFSATDFGFSDPTEGDGFRAVVITTAPASGTLTKGAAVLSGGEAVTAAELAAGDLVFTPAPDGSGVAYTSFTFQVQDDGGTANGGIDLDPTPNTLTIDVDPVNDAPGGTDATVTTNEDTAFTFSAADFGFSDPLDGNGFQAVVVTSTPGSGTLTKGGTALTGGETVTAAELAAGDLVFTPGPDDDGTGYTSFTFQVQDDGGTANGGVDLDPIANTLTIDINPVNDAPSGTDRTLTTDEDTPYIFSVADFGFSDPLEGDSLQSIVITTAPANGTLTKGATVLSGGETVTAAELAAGDLAFTPALHENGIAYTSFTFRVQDDGGTANGGVDLDPTPNSITFDIDPVNDAPQLNPGGPLLTSITEDEISNSGELISTIVAGSISDPDPSDPEGIAVTRLASGNGTWEYSSDSGATWNAIGSVSSSSALLLRDTDRIRFVPDTMNGGTASFDFHAWDRSTGVFGTKSDASATGGNGPFSSASDTARIDVTPVNDAPALASTSLAPVPANTSDPVGESVGSLFAGAFSDVDAGASFSGVAVIGNTAAAAEGVWQYSSDAAASWFAIGTVGDDASALALSTGTRIRFLPAADFSGTPPPLAVRGLDNAYSAGFSSTAPSGESRINVDAGANGGTSPISAASASIATSVTPGPPPPPAGEDPGPSEETTEDPGEELGEAAAAAVAADAPVEVLESASSTSAIAREPARAAAFALRSDAEPAATAAASDERRDDRRDDEDDAARSALGLLENLLTGNLGFLDAANGFIGELDRLREDIADSTSLQRRLISSSATLTAGLSIGYLVWLTRGGLLIASLASSMPVWQLIDPIPILASFGADADEEEDDSLDSMIRRGSTEDEVEDERVSSGEGAG